MMSDLCGQRVRFTADSDCAHGVGVIRGVYADQRADRVARVLVEVLEVCAGPVAVGDLLDIGVQEVSTDLARGAGAIRIEDCTPQLSVRAKAVLRAAGLTTLGHIAALTPAELLRTRNLGRKVLHEVTWALEAHGLSLRTVAG